MRVVALLLCAVALQVHAESQDFSGVISRVFDGDSFLVRNAAGKDINVRLIDIDAPEKDQPYGDRARAALIKLIDSRHVFVHVIDIDKYQRKLARVYREPDRLDVARAMVHDGHVWVYRRTVRDESLVALEESARAAHLGLWALPKSELVPPWKFRYLQRQAKAEQDQSAAAAAH